MFWIGLFWGIAIGLGAMFVVHKGIAVKWYEWVLGGIALLLLTITVQHYFGSMNEYEPTAAWMGVLVLGILTLLFAGVTFQLVWRHNKAG